MLLKWVNPKINRPRYGRLYGLARKPVILNQEMYFPVIVSDRKKCVLPIIEELISGGLGMFPRQIWKLIIAIEMNAVMLRTRLMALL